MEYRILVVEEDAARRRSYVEALIAAPPALGVGYKIAATSSAAAAKLQATRQRFDLVLTQLSAKGSSLELVEKLKDLDPTLRVLFIRDPSANLAQVSTAASLGARIVDQDIAAPDICQAIAELLGLRAPAPTVCTVPPPEPTPVVTLADVQGMLDELRRQVHAQLALYTDNLGNVVARCGDDAGVDIAALTSLIAGSFVNSLELGRMLRDPSASHLSVHEGLHYDVYATNAGADHLLAIVFDKQLANPKLGYVWLLLKRNAMQLRQMRLAANQRGAALEQLPTSLNDEFDRLFGHELVAH